MTVTTSEIHIDTKGFADIHDLTSEIRREFESAALSDGVVTVFVPGSTAGITTLEFEPGAIADLKAAIERLAPRDIEYHHNRRWGDGNGFSHVRSAIIGPSLSVPFKNGELLLGTWQQIILIDFDNRSRHRAVIAQFIGA